MFWHRNWFGRSTQKRRQATRSARSRPRQLEQLEGRALLSLSPPVAINYPAAPAGNIDIFATDSTDDSLREYHNGSWLDRGTPANGIGLVPFIPAVATYPTRGGQVLENVFVLGFPQADAPNGSPYGTGLYLDSFNGTSWKWSDLGAPAKGVVLADVAVTTDYQTAGGKVLENVFVTGFTVKRHHVESPSTYLDSFNGTTWKWSNLGNPDPGGEGFVAAVANYQVSGGPLDENAFAIASNGDMYLDTYNGTKWTSWTDLGTPNPGVSLNDGTFPSVVNYQPPGQSLTQQVFVTGSDGRLYHWSLYDNGTKSGWYGLGYGYGGESLSDPAAITYQVAGGTLHLNVFAVGQDGNLYLDYYDGAHWNKVALGGPGAGADLDSSTAFAVINYLSVTFVPPSSVLHEHVFVLGTNDDSLYDDYWNGSQWTWQGPF